MDADKTATVMDHSAPCSPAAVHALWPSQPEAVVNEQLYELYYGAIAAGLPAVAAKAASILGSAHVAWLPNDRVLKSLHRQLENAAKTVADNWPAETSVSGIAQTFFETLSLLSIDPGCQDSQGFGFIHYVVRALPLGHRVNTEVELLSCLMAKGSFHDAFWSRDNIDQRHALATFLADSRQCGVEILPFMGWQAGGTPEHSWYETALLHDNGHDRPDAHGYTLFELAASTLLWPLLSHAPKHHDFTPGQHSLARILYLWINKAAPTLGLYGNNDSSVNLDRLQGLGLDFDQPFKGKLAGDLLVDAAFFHTQSDTAINNGDDRAASAPSPSMRARVSAYVRQADWFLRNRPDLIPSLVGSPGRMASFCACVAPYLRREIMLQMYDGALVRGLLDYAGADFPAHTTSSAPTL